MEITRAPSPSQGTHCASTVGRRNRDHKITGVAQCLWRARNCRVTAVLWLAFAFWVSSDPRLAHNIRVTAPPRLEFSEWVSNLARLASAHWVSSLFRLALECWVSGSSRHAPPYRMSGNVRLAAHCWVSLWTARYEILGVLDTTARHNASGVLYTTTRWVIGCLTPRGFGFDSHFGLGCL